MSPTMVTMFLLKKRRNSLFWYSELIMYQNNIIHKLSINIFHTRTIHIWRPWKSPLWNNCRGNAPSLDLLKKISHVTTGFTSHTTHNGFIFLDMNSLWEGRPYKSKFWNSTVNYSRCGNYSNKPDISRKTKTVEIGDLFIKENK